MKKILLPASSSLYEKKTTYFFDGVKTQITPDVDPISTGFVLIPSNFRTGRVNLILLSDKVSLKGCGIICILSGMIALTYFSH